MNWLEEWLIDKAMDRLELTDHKPDFIIGKPSSPYLNRWYVISKNPFFNVYLHQFLRSDEDFAIHDHPWLFNRSRLLWETRYMEVTRGKDGKLVVACIPRGATKFRWGKAPHRVMLYDMLDPTRAFIPEIAWTLFITGPVVRTWGFYCPKGWVRFKDIVLYQKGKGSEPSRGCP